MQSHLDIRLPKLHHLLFNSIAKLPPLYNELAMASRAGCPTEVYETYYPDENIPPAPQLPGIEVKRARLLMRKLTRGQSGLFKLLRFVEWSARAFFTALRSGSDVLVAHDLPAVPAAWLSARIRGKKIVYNAHEIWGESNGITAPAPRLWRTLDRFFCPRVDALVVPEHHRALVYKKDYGAKAPYVARNLPLRRPCVRSNKLRDFVRAAGSDIDIIILYQGIFDPGRGLAELIAAMPLVQARAGLVLMGRGSEEQISTLKDRIEALELHSRVFLHPFVEYASLHEYTSSADIGTLFYKNDCRNNAYCAPNKLYEYMQSGLSVLGSDVPGLTSLIETLGVGLTVDATDPAAIAGGLNSLLPEHIRDGHRRKALALSSGELNWETEYAVLEHLYDSLRKSV